MSGNQTFHQLLRAHVTGRGYSAGKLSRLTGIAKTSIENWLKITQKRPPMPRHWTDIAKLSHAIGLDLEQTNTLLVTAGHGRLQEQVLASASDEERALLEKWGLALSEASDYGPRKQLRRRPSLNRAYDKFFGRQQQLTDLHALITNPSVRIVVVTGMSGVGKSSLMTELAIQLADTAKFEVCSMSLRELGHFSIEAVATTILTQIIGQFRDQLSALAVLAEWLRQRNILILLDNLNSLSQNQVHTLVSYLQRVLPEAGTSKAILTTQTPIRELSNWSFAQHLKLDTGLSTAEALQMIQHYFPKLNSEESDIALRAIPLIDGNPKLLEVMIGKARRWGWLRAYQEALSMDGEVGESTAQLIKSSLLSCSKEAALLLELSIVLPTGTFLIEEMHALVGADMNVRWELEQLVESGLASFQNGVGAFRIHQLVSDVIDKRFNRKTHKPEQAAAKLGHYYADLLKNRNFLVAVSQTILQNIIAVAHRWANSAEPIWGRLYCLLGQYFYYVRDFVNAVLMFEKVLALTAGRVVSERATALHFLAITQSGPHTGHFHKRDAISLYEESIQLRQQLGESLPQAYALSDLGYELFHREQLDRAQTYVESALKLGEQQILASPEEHLLWGIILRTTGLFFRHQGNFLKASWYYQSSQTHLESSGNPIELNDTICSYAAMLVDMNELEPAIAILRTAVARGEVHVGSLDLTYTWSVLGKALTLRGDLDSAVAAYQASIQSGSGLPFIEAANVQFIAHYGLGRIELRRGNYPMASAHLQESIRLRKLIGHEQDIPIVLLLLAEVLSKSRSTRTSHLLPAQCHSYHWHPPQQQDTVGSRTSVCHAQRDE
ncbi:MAG: ATP-binding protein [Anaerolineae bacterium]|nr:ATP-binding protein [Anaerolineae bacterium]